MHHHSCFHRAFGHVASFLALCLLVVVTPARADVRILASPGGEVGSYIKLFSVLRQSGQRVIVDGPCFSACTLVLSALEADARGHEEQVVTGLQTLVRPRELREPRDDVDPSSRRMEIDDLKRAIATYNTVAKR